MKKQLKESKYLPLDLVTCQVGLNDKGEGTTTSNFNAFAEEFFKEYSTKDSFTKYVKGFTAVVVYKEDGLKNVLSYKLLDGGIYACGFAAPEASFDANLAGQIDIVINTLKSVN